MEETMNLDNIFKILKKRWKLIIFCSIVVASIGGGITFYVLTPQYQASTQILVNQKNSDNLVDINQLNSNISMINTYSMIIKSPAILNKVIDSLELKENAEELNRKITINSQNNSQVFSLTVQYNDANKATLIANLLSETFQREIKNIMNVDNVSILAKAELQENPIPVKPNPVLNIAISILLGLMIGIGWSFLLEYMDNTIKNPNDTEALLELPILGSISKMDRKLKKRSKEFTRKQIRSESIGS